MVSENWKNTNKVGSSFPRAFRDSPSVSSGAPRPKRSRREGNAFLGFLMLVALRTALLWSAVRVAESAEIVTWQLSVWESLKLATLYVVWQSLSLMVWSGAKRQ